jgi:hypothetical protein
LFTLALLISTALSIAGNGGRAVADAQLALDVDTVAPSVEMAEPALLAGVGSFGVLKKPRPG